MSARRFIFIFEYKFIISKFYLTFNHSQYASNRWCIPDEIHSECIYHGDLVREECVLSHKFASSQRYIYKHNTFDNNNNKRVWNGQFTLYQQNSQRILACLFGCNPIWELINNNVWTESEGGRAREKAFVIMHNQLTIRGKKPLKQRSRCNKFE